MTGPRARLISVIAALVLVGGAFPAPAAGAVAGPVTLKLSPIASGFSKPVLLTGANDGTGRRFVVEKTGTIRVIKSSTVLPTPLLDISPYVSKGNEQGLLGLAFHPAFKTSRKFYVYFTDTNGDTAVNEYKVKYSNRDVVDPASRRRILSIDQPFSNHNGGMLAFGKDGYLYIGLGDGGDAGDPGNRAQNLNALLGKILRIDVSGTSGAKQYRIPATNPFVGRAGADEIWSYGLRNPWRFSFDRLTADLWIGDVGQGTWEEVDHAFKHADGAGRGYNFGWRVLEGRHCYNPSTGCSMAGKVLPQLEYRHSAGRCSITGGYVYRGSTYPDMVGNYFFGDYCTGEIWMLPIGASSPATATLLADTDVAISGFGQDDAGELYVVGLDGDIYQLQDG